MAIRPSTAPTTAALVRDLTGPDPVRREAAVARLAIAGARAVDPLLQALPTASSSGQAAILRVLEAIAPPRALPAAVAATTSTDTAVAVAAVGAVRPHLVASDSRTAESALATLMRVALDSSGDEAVRIAAVAALSDTEPAIREAVRDGLRQEPSERVRRAAGLDGTVGGETEVAAAQLESAITRHEGDPELLRRLLEEAGDDVALSTLHDLVLYLREQERVSAAPLPRRQWTEARAGAHRAFARRGSRLALFDLREALAELPADRLAEFSAAAAAVGDASCLDGLAIAWTRAGTNDQRQMIGGTVSTILAREGLTRRHAALKRALARAPGLAAWLPAAHPRKRQS